ncbi:hypothetical protein [Mangrovactinospora gilvigrisea]|nr:hypothetical protein [Mangrovactinospora gilvigrisea]
MMRALLTAHPNAATAHQVAFADQDDTETLKRLIHKLGGWPTLAPVGELASSAALVLAERAIAEREFQRRALARKASSSPIPTPCALESTVPSTTLSLPPAYAWLALAVEPPELRAMALQELDSGQTALPVGTAFDVVRTAAATGLEAIPHLQHAGEQIGPVLLASTAPACRTYFLLPPGSTERWRAPGSRALPKQGDRLTVPGSGPCGGRIWLVPPDGRGVLTAPDALAAALQRVAEQVAAA